jgi:pilus assembly protein CpaF
MSGKHRDFMHFRRTDGTEMEAGPIDVWALRQQLVNRDPITSHKASLPVLDPAAIERLKASVESLLAEKGSTPHRISPTPENMEVLLDELVGFGPLAPYLRDPATRAVYVARRDRVLVQRDEGLRDVEGAGFTDRAHYRDTLNRIVTCAGRALSRDFPLLDLGILAGFRVTVVGPPLTENDSYLLAFRRED